MQLAGIGVPGHLVIARVIELMSKLDSRWVLEEAGAAAASYRTVPERLRVYAKAEWRRRMSGMFPGPALSAPDCAVPPSVCIRRVNSVAIAQVGYRASPRRRTRRSGRGSRARPRVVW